MGLFNLVVAGLGITFSIAPGIISSLRGAKRKFVNFKLERKPGTYRTPDQYEVVVDDRTYLVNCIGEIPEPDRSIVRDNTLSHLNWNLHLLRDDPGALLRECKRCKQKWYPHQSHDFLGCKNVGDPLIHSIIKAEATKAHVERVLSDHRAEKILQQDQCSSNEDKARAPSLALSAGPRGHLRLVPGCGKSSPK